MRNEDECGFDLLGADTSLGKSAEQKRYEEDMKQYNQQVDTFNAAMTDYWKKNPKATDADVARFKASWGSAVRPVAPVALAAKGCHANGMTVWHWLFFLLLALIIVYAPRVIAYVRSRREAEDDVFTEPTTPVEARAQE
jgi:hypothetical protein